jgi:hypothetical protein
MLRHVIAGALAAVASQWVVNRFIGTPATNGQVLGQLAVRAAAGAAVVALVCR